MPEMGEVAHAAAMLRRFLLGKTIKSVSASTDEIVFVKPLTETIFQKRLTGQKVTDIGRHGKYFWFECSNKFTVLLHFGMTGWITVKDIQTHFVAMESGGDKKMKSKIAELEAAGEELPPIVIEEKPSELWPPKFVKFTLTTDDSREIAFADPRRLGRIRILDAPVSEISKLEPLSKLGTDFSQDKLDSATLGETIAKRKVPIKALLLDQAVFSGIGNWMADEILYQARIHPEQYANTLDATQLGEIYAKLIHVCDVSVVNEGNTAAFPKSWLMLHRWGKGRKKEKQETHDGYEVAHITVGGRTSCYVPELQKLVRVTVKDEAEVEIPVKAPKAAKASKGAKSKTSKRGAKAETETETETGNDQLDEPKISPTSPAETRRPKRAKKAAAVKDEVQEVTVEIVDVPKPRTRGRRAK